MVFILFGFITVEYFKTVVHIYQLHCLPLFITDRLNNYLLVFGSVLPNHIKHQRI